MNFVIIDLFIFIFCLKLLLKFQRILIIWATDKAARLEKMMIPQKILTAGHLLNELWNLIVCKHFKKDWTSNLEIDLNCNKKCMKICFGKFVFFCYSELVQALLTNDGTNFREPLDVNVVNEKGDSFFHQIINKVFSKLII